MLYFNHAGTSFPKPQAVLDAVQSGLASSPALGPELLTQASAAIARALALPEPERLRLTPGGTAALNVAISEFEWQPGDVVVTSALEHEALVGPIQRLVRELGVRHHVAPRSADGPIDLDDVRRILQRERVRLVACTTASNVTGELMPVEELAHLAHQYGSLCLLDVAQTLGLIDLDVGEVGADIVAFTGHKAAQGPHGIGGFWASSRVRFRAPSASCELAGTSCEAGHYPGYCSVGSVNLAGALGLAAGLEWTRAHREQLQLARELARGLARLVARWEGIHLLGAPDCPRTTAVALVCDRLPLETAEAEFRKRQLIVRAGQHCAPLALRALAADAGCLRISFGPEHTPDHFDRLVETLLALAGGAPN